jgi:signal transduction histidine kinase
MAFASYVSFTALCLFGRIIVAPAPVPTATGASLWVFPRASRARASLRASLPAPPCPRLPPVLAWAVLAWAVLAWAVLAWAVLAWAVLAWAVLARAVLAWAILIRTLLTQAVVVRPGLGSRVFVFVTFVVAFVFAGRD